MDRIESLTNTLSNITLYDIKSMYTQVYSLCCLQVTKVNHFKSIAGEKCCPEYQRDGGESSRGNQRRSLVRVA